MVARPVTFLPGRAKLATNPLPTGLPTAAITIETVPSLAWQRESVVFPP
jgi:hypothetical protein